MKSLFKTLEKITITCSLVLIACLSLNSCKKGDLTTTTTNTGNTDVDALVNMNVPDNFNYETDQEVNIDIIILAPDDAPIKFIPVNILNKAAEKGGKILFTGLTDENGKITGHVKLPAYYREVVVDPNYIGVMRNAIVSIASKNLTATLGGKSSYLGNVIPETDFHERPIYSNRPLSLYGYMGTYDNQGKPNYLASTNDVITSTLLSYINTSLPEGRPVPTYHPDYLSNNAEINLNITAASDVWFTFISEGAGYRNSIAYFTYPTGHAPQTVQDIDSLHIILPNASLSGSGGSLQSGNKVKLGNFRAGTSIGFALIADGWNGSTVSTTATKFYTADNLNPETSTNLKRHSVLLYDNTNNLFLVGMEDINRSTSGCDNDFNDCIFSLKSEVTAAISTTNVNPIDVPVDTDGDGVTDVYDKFPNDAARAYINYYPSATTYGTLAFEDNWPYLGDYDVNDMVVGYKYTLINDRYNRTVQMKADFVLRAAWASFHDGFGVEFPFTSSTISSVTGTRVTNSNVVTLGSNGCETGQTNAVIIPFDNAIGLMPSPYQATDTIKMTLNFNMPVTAANMGTAPYNPFLIVNGERGRETHLVGNTPTQKADSRLFKTGQDNTNSTQSRYYKTTSNLPYGLSFSENFLYPIEGKSVNAAYTNFVAWAESGGVSSPNWYADTTNMVQINIFK